MIEVSKKDRRKYEAILKEELLTALGCTEPIAIAYAAAKAKETLGTIPDSIIVECSGNLIKNARAVVVPMTEDLRGIEAAAVLGAVGGNCALPGFVDSKNEEKTERNAGYLVVSHSGGGMLRQGTRKGIRRTPANRGMRAHRIVKSLDISEDVCHGLCP